METFLGYESSVSVKQTSYVDPNISCNFESFCVKQQPAIS